jgi:hypothetical protein
MDGHFDEVRPEAGLLISPREIAELDDVLGDDLVLGGSLAERQLSDENIWRLVNYLRALRTKK